MQENDLVILRTRDAIPFDELDGFTVISTGALTYWVSEENPDVEPAKSVYHLELNLDERSSTHFSDVLQDNLPDYKNHYDFNSSLNGTSTSEAYLRRAMLRIGSDA